MAKKKVVAYIRASINADVSIRETYFKTLLANREDCELAGIYVDRGTSGRKKKRYAYQTLIADAVAGKFDYIIVKSLANLSRDTDESIAAIKNLKEHGVGIYSVAERLDTLSDKCKQYIEILETTAELRKQIKEKEREMEALTENDPED